jgi:hypothetical protein
MVLKSGPISVFVSLCSQALGGILTEGREQGNPGAYDRVDLMILPVLSEFLT